MLFVVENPFIFARRNSAAAARPEAASDSRKSAYSASKIWKEWSGCPFWKAHANSRLFARGNGLAHVTITVTVTAGCVVLSESGYRYGGMCRSFRSPPRYLQDNVLIGVICGRYLRIFLYHGGGVWSVCVRYGGRFWSLTGGGMTLPKQSCAQNHRSSR